MTAPALYPTLNLADCLSDVSALLWARMADPTPLNADDLELLAAARDLAVHYAEDADSRNALLADAINSAVTVALALP